MQYYVRISTKMAKDPSMCTDTELVELTTECLQALGSDYEPSGDSSSSDSSSEHIRKKVKVKKGFLTPTPKSFDRTNPYNQAWHTEQYNPCAQQFGYQRDVLIGGQQQQWLTLQQQHEIFQTQVCGQPSLEMCHKHHQLLPFPVFASNPQYLNQPRFGLRFGSPAGSPGRAVNPNIIQPQKAVQAAVKPLQQLPSTKVSDEIKSLFTSTSEASETTSSSVSPHAPSDTEHNTDALFFNEVCIVLPYLKLLCFINCCLVKKKTIK